MWATRKRSGPKDSVTHGFEPRSKTVSRTRALSQAFGVGNEGHWAITASFIPSVRPSLCCHWPAHLRPRVLRGHAVGWPDSGSSLTDGSIQYGCNSRTDQRARSLPILSACESLLLESSEARRRPQVLVLHFGARCTHSGTVVNATRRRAGSLHVLKAGNTSSPRPDEVNFECLLVDLGGWLQASAVRYWTMAHLGRALGWQGSPSPDVALHRQGQRHGSVHEHH